MKIKDFKVGDTVYIIDAEGRNQNDYKIQTETVTKVGRLYVTVGEDWNAELYEAFCDYCLAQKREWGCRKFLFKCESDIDKYFKIKKYTKWLFTNIGGASSHCYTFDQIQSVIAILNPNGEYDNEIN